MHTQRQVSRKYRYLSLVAHGYSSSVFGRVGESRMSACRRDQVIYFVALCLLVLTLVSIGIATTRQLPRSISPCVTVIRLMLVLTTCDKMSTQPYEARESII